MKKIRISEIFTSIQGEGPLQGTVSHFIRFAGCSLRCPWCDQKEAWEDGEEWAIEDIVKEIENKGKFATITITGGEPFEQVDGLLTLLDALRNYGQPISIETNGLYYDPIIANHAALTNIVVSPKLHTNWIKVVQNWLRNKKPVIFKFVITDKRDIKPVVDHILYIKPNCRVYLNPVDNNVDIANAIRKYLIENKVDWKWFKLSTQLHKVYNFK